MGLDVSGSVDAREYRLQLDGLSAALMSADVRRVILADLVAPVSILVFEWSDSGDQGVVADWTVIDGEARLAALAERVRGHQRVVAPDATSIGGAMRYAARQFARGPVCWRQTLDLSGDGRNNAAPLPEQVRSLPAFERITINGLVIGADAPPAHDSRLVEIAELTAYYDTHVIHGAGAFVETALGFEDFQKAMTRKLLRELPSLTLGGGAGPAMPMPAAAPAP